MFMYRKEDLAGLATKAYFCPQHVRFVRGGGTDTLDGTNTLKVN